MAWVVTTAAARADTTVDPQKAARRGRQENRSGEHLLQLAAGQQLLHVVRAADQCTVKKHLEAPPSIAVQTVADA